MLPIGSAPNNAFGKKYLVHGWLRGWQNTSVSVLSTMMSFQGNFLMKQLMLILALSLPWHSTHAADNTSLAQCSMSYYEAASNSCKAAIVGMVTGAGCISFIITAVYGISYLVWPTINESSAFTCAGDFNGQFLSFSKNITESDCVCPQPYVLQNCTHTVGDNVDDKTTAYSAGLATLGCALIDAGVMIGAAATRPARNEYRKTAHVIEAIIVQERSIEPNTVLQNLLNDVNRISTKIFTNEELLFMLNNGAKSEEDGFCTQKHSRIKARLKYNQLVSKIVDDATHGKGWWQFGIAPENPQGSTGDEDIL